MSNVTDVRYGQADDGQLMQSFYDGNNRAFDVLAGRVQASLLHQAYAALPARHVGRRQIAEDLVQKTLVKVFATRSRPQVQWCSRKGKVRTWLGTILRNVVISYLRTRQSRQLVSSDLSRQNPDATWHAPENDLVDHRMPAEVHARHAEARRQRQLEVISSLPDKVRSILYMKMEGLSHHQIADRLGLSKSTISYHYHEAKEKLRTIAAVAA